MELKKRYIKVERPNTHGGLFSVTPEKQFSIQDEFDGCCIEGDTDSVVVSLIWMTDEEFEELGEFEGW